MKITNIRIIPFDTSTVGQHTRAYAEVEFDNIIQIRGIRVLENTRGGLFLSMPAIRTRSGQYKPVVSFKNKEFEKDLRRKILDEFNHFGLNP